MSRTKLPETRADRSILATGIVIQIVVPTIISMVSHMVLVDWLPISTKSKRVNLKTDFSMDMVEKSAITKKTIRSETGRIIKKMVLLPSTKMALALPQSTSSKKINRATLRMATESKI